MLFYYLQKEKKVICSRTSEKIINCTLVEDNQLWDAPCVLYSVLVLQMITTVKRLYSFNKNFCYSFIAYNIYTTITNTI